ncbi:MAG: Fe-S cluster assembly protein SufD [Bacteroidetes bacterium]|nr:Fe-S cluster assembly protein SufD [Bacteroidota bacterium]
MSIVATEQNQSAIDRLSKQFDDLVGSKSDGQESSWIQSRRQAMQAFIQAGFPKKRSESYKYTPVSKWIEKHSHFANEAPSSLFAQSGPLPPLSAPDSKGKSGDSQSAGNRATKAASTSWKSKSGVEIHTQDGHISGSVVGNVPTGLTVCSLKEASLKHPQLFSAYLSKAVVLDRDPFAALATAFAEDGLFIHASESVVTDEVISIHHDGLRSESFVQPRVLIVAEKGASIQVVEHFPHLNAGRTFENRVAEIFVAAEARIDHVLMVERAEEALFVNSLFVYQGEKSYFRTNTITLGGGLVRHNLNFLPNAEECETHLHGLYVAKGYAHVDNHTLVDHAKPNCFSNEMFKGIVTDQATGVFNGKVLVRQDAQKTNAYQSSKCIVLDRGARTYAKPELEIYADDVKCSHGATTGELDEDAIFYLRARGISKDAAKMLLLEAFARDVVDLIAAEGVRNYLYDRLHHLLSVTK